MRFATLFTSVFLALTAASSAQAEPTGLGEAVRLSGSPRLAGFLLTDPDLPVAVRTAGEGLLSRTGHGEAPTVGEGAFSASPFLRYDPNLNGGFPEDHVSVGGLRFEVAEEDQAVSGLIAGVTLSYGWRRGLGGGTAFELRSALSLGRALEQDMVKGSFGAEGCLRHLARRDLYLYGCVDASLARFELGRSERVGARFGVTRLMTGFGGVHELTLEGRAERNLGSLPYDRGGVSLSLLSAMPGPVIYNVRAELGQPVDGVLVTRARVSLGATFELLDRPTSLSLDWRQAEGGTFLGVPREDRTVTLSASRPVTDRVRVSVSLTRNRSTADPYDRDGVGLGVAMRF